MSSRDPFGDDFDKRFDKMWDRHDKIFNTADKGLDAFERHPVRTMLGAGLVVLVLNLLFWGTIIGLIVWGLTVVL